MSMSFISRMKLGHDKTLFEMLSLFHDIHIVSPPRLGTRYISGLDPCHHQSGGRGVIHFAQPTQA